MQNRATRQPSILTRPRPKPAAIQPPERDPYLGDRSPEWAVYYFLTLSKAEFDARYGVQARIQVSLDDGSTTKRFLARRPNILCVKSPDQIVAASEDRLLRDLVDRFLA